METGRVGERLRKAGGKAPIRSRCGMPKRIRDMRKPASGIMSWDANTIICMFDNHSLDKSEKGSHPKPDE